MPQVKETGYFPAEPLKRPSTAVQKLFRTGSGAGSVPTENGRPIFPLRDFGQAKILMASPGKVSRSSRMNGMSARCFLSKSGPMPDSQASIGLKPGGQIEEIAAIEEKL